MNEVLESLQHLIGPGLDSQELNTLQVTARSLIVFVAALIIIRCSARRFLARKTAFDMILAFILGSTLSRAINGSAPLIPTLVGSMFLVLFHHVLAMLACRYHFWGFLIKGRVETIIDNGRVQTESMLKHHLSEGDLLEDLRLQSCETPEQVQSARLERSGELSVVRKETAS
jgi:uncharacterized membrane protein YcaP (DUF421 family)